MASPLYTSPSEGPVDRLQLAVERGLRERIKEIVDVEANKAAAEVERLVREETAKIAARIANRMYFERHAHELVIRIDFSDGTQKKSAIDPSRNIYGQ